MTGEGGAVAAGPATHFTIATGRQHHQATGATADFSPRPGCQDTVVVDFSTLLLDTLGFAADEFVAIGYEDTAGRGWITGVGSPADAAAVVGFQNRGCSQECRDSRSRTLFRLTLQRRSRSA